MACYPELPILCSEHLFRLQSYLKRCQLIKHVMLYSSLGWLPSLESYLSSEEYFRGSLTSFLM